ncbi:MAG: hypothetical protein JST39_18575, partial [Bacteroidetes bacterium]|nr:hypothetical protein [Bacteroidota bacterium]
MDIPLLELMRFVLLRLDPKKQFKTIPSDEEVEGWTLKIRSCCHAAAEQILSVHSAPAAVSNFPEFVSQQQYLVTKCMDRLYTDRFGNLADPTIPIREEAVTRLNAIYRLLYDCFPQFFDEEAKMPNWRLDIAHYRFRYQVKLLKEAFALRKTDEAFVKIIFLGYDQFIYKYGDPETKS